MAAHANSRVNVAHALQTLLITGAAGQWETTPLGIGGDFGADRGRHVKHGGKAIDRSMITGRRAI